MKDGKTYLIETRRLELRELTAGDAAHFYQLNNDPDVIKYTGDPPFPSVKAAREFLKNYGQYARYGYGRWAVIRLDAMGNQNGVKTPFFLLFSFFFSSIALLCTRKKASTAEKMTVFAISFSHRIKSISKETGEFLGWCGLKYVPSLRETDLGFRFFRRHWGRGYATEAATACVNYGIEKLGLTKIVGRAMMANKASIRVLEKAGLRFVEEREFEEHPGGYFAIG